MIYFECVFTELKKSLFISCLYKTMKNYQIILIFFALATFIVTKKKNFIKHIFAIHNDINFNNYMKKLFC